MDSAIVAQRQTVDATTEARIEDSVSVSYAFVDYESAQYFFSYQAVGITNYLWLAPGFELGVGGRLGIDPNLVGGHAFEGFASVSIVPRFPMLRDEAHMTASWRPAAGIEVGLSSAQVKFVRTVAPESVDRDDPQPGAAYLAFVARPLRFRLTNFNVTALGIGLGAPFAKSGTKLRVQLELLQIGWIL